MTTDSRSPDGSLPGFEDAALDRLRRFGGAKLLGKMIDLFLEAAPERIGAARAAVERGDAAAAEQSLHSLKSSAAQLGALRMQRLSEEGELRARTGTVDGVDRTVAELEQELVKVQGWLTRARDEDPA